MIFLNSSILAVALPCAVSYNFLQTIYFFSILDTVFIPVLTRLIRDYSVFYAVHLAKVSPSTKCVTAPSAVRTNANIFSHYSRVSLKHIIKSNVICFLINYISIHILLILWFILFSNLNSFCLLMRFVL
jgi:hypothetical protein